MTTPHSEMKDLRDRWIELDVNRRADYMRTRGQEATLRVGPFGFSVSTADGLWFGFSIRVWRWVLGWDVQPVSR